MVFLKWLLKITFQHRLVKKNGTRIKRIRQVGGRGLKLFMIQEIRENQRCLHQRYQRSNP
jgi:hypothetical protein